MEIEIIIRDAEGNVMFRTVCLSVSSAENELSRFERHVLPTLKEEKLEETSF